jgi:thiol-disulfide isomerase/thioredoxin
MELKASMLAFFTVFLLLFFNGCTSNTTDNILSNGNNNGPNDYSWLENYSAVHFVGNGSDDFWIEFPQCNPSSGETVEHLQWLTESMENNSTLFVVHKTGCTGCKAQADRVIAFAEKYEEQVVFYDLDISLGGITEQRAYMAYRYDPDGPPKYIALTGVFTYVNDSGEVKIGWHTWEGNVEDSEMESWIKDAIYYCNLDKVSI